MKMGLALGIAAVAFVNFVAPASAEPIDNIAAVAEKVAAFYCTSTTADPRIIIFAPEKGSMPEKLLMYPEAYPSRLIGRVFTADLPDGTLSLDGKNLAILSGDGLETGTCKSFNSELMGFMFALASADPELLAGAASGAALAEQQFKIESLESKVSTLNDALAAGQSDLVELKTDRNNSNPFKDDIDRLKRENEKLKSRICKLDPKATFAVCKDGGAP